MTEAVILLGSNVGNRKNHVMMARMYIANQVGSILRISSLYDTHPWGNTKQPSFINQVVVIQYDYDAMTLLQSVLQIENKLGRRRTEKWGPRTIDIDILFFGHEIIQKNELTIPHQGIPLRRFVLTPLLECMPEFVHPVFHCTIREMYTTCEDQTAVKQMKS